MIDDPDHHAWLAAETGRLLDFYRAAALPAGGFGWLDDHGRPVAGEPTYLWITARMVHCFALAQLLGDPAAAGLVDHGLAALAGPLRDPAHGGWFWSVGPDGQPVDDRKQAYGHAFVLLAAASAVQAGRPGARALLADAAAVLDRHFWQEADQLSVDSYRRDWTGLDPYRGANANMHLVEAYLAAASLAGSAGGDPGLGDRATAIAARLVRDQLDTGGWRLPEHFDPGWRPLPDYHAEAVRDPFRPYGSTVGHWLEWSRLLWQLPGPPGWAPDAAVQLFDRAVAEGWDTRRSGFVYTVDWDGRPVVTDRLHWVVTEAIGAAVALYRATGEARYDRWYARFWDHARAWFIDEEHGSWVPQRDAQRRRVADPWHGKPDLYHSLQATLYARIPAGCALPAAVSRLPR